MMKNLSSLPVVFLVLLWWVECHVLDPGDGPDQETHTRFSQVAACSRLSLYRHRSADSVRE